MKKIYSLAQLLALTCCLLIAASSDLRAQCANVNTAQSTACWAQWTGISNAGYITPTNSTNTASVGYGTYTFFSNCVGDNYQFGLCGTAADSKISAGVVTSGSWTLYAYDDDDGPLCSTSTSASLGYVGQVGNYAASLGSSLIEVHSWNTASTNSCGGWVSGQASMVLSYIDNGACAPGTPTGGGSFCNSTTLSGTGPSGTITYYWQTSTTGTSTANGLSTFTPTYASYPGTTIFYQRPYNSCSGIWGYASGGVSVTLYQTPTSPTITTATLNYCGTLTSGSLGGNAPSVGTGTWAAVSGPGTPTFSAVNTNTSTATVNAYGSYVFKWTISNGSCAGSSATVTVNYYQTPTTATVGSATLNYCGTLTSASLAANTVSAGTGTWTQTSGSGTSTFSGVNSNTSTATAPSAGTYVYQWTMSNGTCSTTSASVTVNYYATPTTATVGSSTLNYCGTLTSGSLAANTVSVGTGTWTKVSGTGTVTFSGVNSNTSTATAPSAGTYVYQWTMSNGTCSTTSASVTVNYYATPPAATVSSGTLNYCGTLTSGSLGGNTASPGTGTWTKVSGTGTVTFSNANSETSTATAPSTGTYVYAWTIGNGTCSTSSATVTVNYYGTPPAATVSSGTLNYCGTLTSGSLGGNTASPGTGTWTKVSGTGTVTFSNANSETSTATAPSTGTYVYAWTIGNGTCSTSSATVTVNYYGTPPAATVSSGTLNYCGTLTSGSLGGNTASPGTGTWTKVSGTGTVTFSNANSETSTATTPSAGTYVYAWTIGNGTCSTSSATVTVNYYATPTTASITGSNPLNYCGTLTSGSLGGNTATIGTGTWTKVSGTGTVTFSNANSETSTATAPSAGTYVYAWTIGNGTCSTSSATVTVNYYATPTTASITGSNPLNYCGTLTSGSLGGNTATIGTGTWTKVSGTGTVTFSNANSETSTATAPSTGTYVYAWTIGNGTCSTTSATVTVNYYATPPTATVTTPTLNYCATLTSTSLGGDAASPGTGTWTQVSGTGTTTFSSVNSGTSTATAPSAGTYVYAWTIGNGSCSTSSATVTVNFYATPTTASITSTPLNYCGTLTSGSLGGNTATIGTGTWTQTSGTGTSTFSGVNSETSTATAPSAGTYVYQWTIGNGTCSTTSASVTVNYYATPTTASITGSNPLNYCGTLTSGSLGGNTASPGTGTWSKVSGPGTVTFSATTVATSTATVSIAGTYVYAWTIGNGTCSTTSATVTVNYYATPTTASVSSGTLNYCGTLTSGSLGGNTATIGTGTWTQVSGTGTSTFSSVNSATSTATATTAGTYVYAWTIGNGTCSTTSATVTVNYYQSPTTATIATNPLNYCGTLTSGSLGGSTATVGTGTWTKISGTGTVTFSNANSETSTVTVPSAGTYVFQWSIANGTCTPSTATVTVNYYTAPTANAGTTTSASACASNNVYTIPSGYTYANGTVSWQTSGDGSFSNGGTVTPTYVFGAGDISTGGAITLTMHVSNGTCTDATAPFTLTISNAPTATQGGTTFASKCASVGSYTIPSGYSNTNGTIQWYTSGDGTFTNGTTATPTYTFGPTDISTGGGIALTMHSVHPPCADATAGFTLFISPVPVATQGTTHSATVCGTDLMYTIPAGYVATNGTITWTSNGDGDFTTNNPANATTTTPTYTFGPTDISTGANVTLTMTVSDAPCTSSSTSFNLHIKIAPTATQGGTTSDTKCASDNTYTIPSGYTVANGTIAWSTSGDGSFTSGATTLTPTYTFGTNDKAIGGAITLTLHSVNSPCADGTAPFTLNIKPVPTATPGSTTSDTKCASDLTYTIPSGYTATNGTISWTTSGDGTFTSGATTTTPTYTFGTTDKTTTSGANITLTMHVANSPCTSVSTAFYLTVMPQPTATAGSTTSDTKCASDLTYTIPSGYTVANGVISWTTSGDGSFTSGATTLTPTYTFGTNDMAVGGAITLTLHSTMAPCSMDGTAPFTLTIKPVPTATPGSTNTATKCASDNTYTIPSGYASTNGTISWTTSGDGSFTSGATTLTPTYTFGTTDKTAGGLITLTMHVANSPCTEATTTFGLTISQSPSATQGTTHTATKCATDLTYTIPSGYASANGTISWVSSGDGSFTSGATTLTPTYTFGTNDKASGGAVTLTMHVTNSPCADATATFTLTINVGPSPTISTSGLFCTGGAATYTTQAGESNYIWTIPGTPGTNYNILSGGTTSDNTVQVEWLTVGSQTVTVNYTDATSGCPAQAANIGTNTTNSTAGPTAASITDVIEPCLGGHTATVSITGGTSPYSYTLCGTPYTSRPAYFQLDAGANTSCSLTGVTDALGCGVTAIPSSVTYPTRTLSVGDSVSCMVNTNATQIFYDNSGNLISKVVDLGGTLNTTDVNIYIDNPGTATCNQFGPTSLQSYLQRHYAISPANQSGSATVSLYLTETEATNLDAASLANDSHVAPAYYPEFLSNLSNIAITKFHGGRGTPQNNTARMVIPTSSISVVHNPTVNGVTYNNAYEVTFTISTWSGFYIHGQNGNNTPLPVTLLYLTADAIDNKYIQLDWATASEINNKGFDIERSTDGVNFATIGWVDGHGNSNSQINYTSDDKTAQPGITYYYRLKQVDVDGHFEYSEIVSASLTGDKSFVFEDLIPNPASNSVQLGILSNIGQKSTITMTDMLGRVVLNNQWQLSEGYNVSTFDISAIAAGTYNVTIYSGSIYATKRLVITK